MYVKLLTRTLFQVDSSINHKIYKKEKDYEKAINDGMPRSLCLNWM